MIGFKRIKHPSGRTEYEFSLNMVTATYTLMLVAFAIVCVMVFAWR